MPIKIDSHIPLPKGWKKEKLPLEAMKIGDSFFIQEEAQKVSKCINMKQRRGLIPLRRFIVRTESNGCRVWRAE